MYKGLSAQQIQFCNEYCVDFNATKAYIRAKYSANGAGPSASALLQNPNIQNRIGERMSELAAATALTPEWVIERWMELALGDAGELSRVRRINCRHCWGHGGFYQWTPQQYRRAVEDNLAQKPPQPAPDYTGGLDFDLRREPNPACLECKGDGDMTAFLEDTGKVTGYSRKLFAGVKQTNNGIEIKLRDQDVALANLAKYLGMSIEKREFSGPGGKPIPLASVTAKDMTDDQLAAMLQAESE